MCTFELFPKDVKFSFSNFSTEMIFTYVKRIFYKKSEWSKQERQHFACHMANLDMCRKFEYDFQVVELQNETIHQSIKKYEKQKFENVIAIFKTYYIKKQ